MVGQKKAREIWFLCKQYTAREAEQMGMVNRVVPFDALEDACVEWAEVMMERSPLALRMIKAGLNAEDRKSTRLNSSHANISYAVFCLKKKNNICSTYL